ncbi:MAG: PTS sugar transporter subunit IIA [Treponemataceae bacterium]
MTESSGNPNLIELVKRGGVFYNLSGNTPSEVLADAVSAIPLPEGIDRAKLLTAVLEREALMPTAIGDGIALPHPRSPLILDPARQFVAVCFLRQPIDWRALDGKPVGTAILIFSASPRLHLQTLSRVNFLCRQSAFRKLLQGRASREELVAAIEAAERTWS